MIEKKLWFKVSPIKKFEIIKVAILNTTVIP